MQRLNQAISDAEQHSSSESLNRLKEAYQKEFPNREKLDEARLRDAKSVTDVLSIFAGVMDQGMRVHFTVKTLFKRADDEDDQPPPAKQASKGHKPETDDDDKDKKSPKPAKAKESQDDDDEKGSFDVWAPFQGCQLDFQIGETYLVYAKNDESSGLFFTSSCMRTRRISDAGADLSYLYFYKSDPNRSSRLEGFTTTDRKASLTFDALHDPESVKSPVPEVILQLRSNDLTRYATADNNGRFIYDGLPAGDYELSAFNPEYPLAPERLAAPQSFHIEAKSCASQILLLPPATGR
jgi:hypothetical protein